MQYILTKDVKSPSNPPIYKPQYLTKNSLPRIILAIHLKMNLSEEFNLNLGYILIGISDPDNQDNTL